MTKSNIYITGFIGIKIILTFILMIILVLLCKINGMLNFDKNIFDKFKGLIINFNYKKNTKGHTIIFENHEENILAKRLAKIQKKNYVVTDVEFQHKISASIDKNITDIRTKFKMAQAGRRIYLGKYLGCCKALIVATDIVSLIGRNVYCLISKI